MLLHNRRDLSKEAARHYPPVITPRDRVSANIDSKTTANDVQKGEGPACKA